MDSDFLWHSIGGGAIIAAALTLARLLLDYGLRGGERRVEQDERRRSQQRDAEARLERLLQDRLAESDRRLERCDLEFVVAPGPSCSAWSKPTRCSKRRPRRARPRTRTDCPASPAAERSAWPRSSRLAANADRLAPKPGRRARDRGGSPRGGAEGLSGCPGSRTRPARCARSPWPIRRADRSR